MNDKNKIRSNLTLTSNSANTNKISKRNSLLNKFNITKKQNPNITETANGTKLIMYISNDEELVLDLAEAMVMIVPIRYGAKKYWYLMFPNFERLT